MSNVDLPGLNQPALFTLLGPTTAPDPALLAPALLAARGYLRPLLAPLLNASGATPVADAILSVLDTSYSGMAAALQQTRADHDPRLATGLNLRAIARRYGLDYLPGEDDDGLRRRLLAGPTQNPSTKAGIAAGVTALTGVPVTAVTDAPGSFVVTLFANSPRAGEVMPLVRRLKAGGMRPRGQMLVGQPASSRLGQVLLGKGRLGGASTMIALPDPTAATLMSAVSVNTTQRSFTMARPMGRALLGTATLGNVTLGH